MAVKTESVEHTEREKGSVIAPEPEAQLLVLRQRIRAGLNQVGHDPRPKDAPACQECFQRGWLAAMRSLGE